jgi:hypothetical protein
MFGPADNGANAYDKNVDQYMVTFLLHPWVINAAQAIHQWHDVGNIFFQGCPPKEVDSRSCRASSQRAQLRIIFSPTEQAQTAEGATRCTVMV